MQHLLWGATYESTNVSLSCPVIAVGWVSEILNILSITDNSVEVVSKPQNAHQSFTTKPAPIASLPLFTVPA